MSKALRFMPGGGYDPYNSADTYRAHVIERLERDLENAAVDRLIRRAFKKAAPLAEMLKMFRARPRIRIT